MADHYLQIMKRRHEFVLNNISQTARPMGEMGVGMLFSSAFYSQNLS